LFFVRQILPLTPSADSEVLAERNGTHLTIFYEAYYFTFGKGMFLAANLYVAYIARYAERYEDYEFTPVEEALTLGGYCFYRDALKER
jgi:hypothetical protein